MHRRRHALLIPLAFTACAPVPPPAPPAPRAPASRHAPPPEPTPEPPPVPVPAPEPPSSPPPPAPAPRLTSRGYVTWIYPRPRADRHLGYIRNGSSIALRSTEVVPGEGCPGGFFPVVPRGFVCNDHTVTLTPSPRFLETAEAAAASTGPLPYRYAFSDGAPMYNRVPSPDEQARFERGLGPAGAQRSPFDHPSTYQDLATLDAIDPVDPMPPFLAGAGTAAEDRFGLIKESVVPGSIVSYTRAFSAAGRTFLLTAKQTLVPADRMRAFHPSTFHGVRLGGGVSLPIAWIRGAARLRFRRSPSGAIEQASGAWAVRTFARLGGAVLEQGGERFLETLEREDDGAALYLREQDATVVTAATALPTGVKPGRKWMLVSITQGTLVAYEGLTPVFATLISPGRGGVSEPGRDHVSDSATPIGTYNITFKDRAATMSADPAGGFLTHFIADVPYVQYFRAPFALHGAYWHDRFGEPASAGCINASPLDAEALFAWSDPAVPEGWQGATGAGAPENGGTTAIVVKR